jgi:hypothetical protein
MNAKMSWVYGLNSNVVHRSVQHVNNSAAISNRSTGLGANNNNNYNNLPNAFNPSLSPQPNAPTGFYQN